MSDCILIVDDEAYLRALLEQTLEPLADDHGVRLEVAVDGTEALELARKIFPRLIFLDIMMPGKDGMHVCQELRQDPRFDNTTIVLLTARGQQVDREAGLMLGANHYITKPFDPDAVLSLAADVVLAGH